MECTLQNLSEKYYDVFMTNMMSLLGNVSGLVVSAVVIVPAWSFYSERVFQMVNKVKRTISMQTEHLE
jgi:hypothetical protein